MYIPLRWLPVLAVSFLVACGDKAADTVSQPDENSPASAAAQPAATGKVIEVKAITDDQGNRYEPREIEASPGDVLRLVLVSGVHNIHFLPDSNPGKSGLPAASEMLQLPGQTLDVPITFGAGEYYFQCDPHAPLGMTGKLEVEDDHD